MRFQHNASTFHKNTPPDLILSGGGEIELSETNQRADTAPEGRWD
jgi:hypothetical protein